MVMTLGQQQCGVPPLSQKVLLGSTVLPMKKNELQDEVRQCVQAPVILKSWDWWKERRPRDTWDADHLQAPHHDAVSVLTYSCVSVNTKTEVQNPTLR